MADPSTQRPLPDWLSRWLANHTPACREIARLASEGLDRKLTWRECLHIRMHYAICYLCRRYEDQLRVLHQGLGKNGEQFSECSKTTLSNEDKARLKKVCSGK